MRRNRRLLELLAYLGNRSPQAIEGISAGWDRAEVIASRGQGHRSRKESFARKLRRLEDRFPDSTTVNRQLAAVGTHEQRERHELIASAVKRAERRRKERHERRRQRRNRK